MTGLIIKLLLSLTGIVIGVILAKIAAEELKLGDKYFEIIRRALFVILFLVINYYFLMEKMIVHLIIFALLMILLFAANLFFVSHRKVKKQYLEAANYLVFIIPYLLIGDSAFQLLIVSLIFLYGFPVGTLLAMHLKYHRNRGIDRGQDD